MTSITDKHIEAYCKQHSTKESTLLETVRQEALSFAPQADMCSNSLSGALLRTLATLKHPKHILEIGMFFGYATLCMLQGCKEAKITCLETDKAVIAKAEKYFKLYGTNSITVVQGDAKVTLPKLLEQNSFDFIFIDADKRSYPQYVEMCCDHLGSGGVIVIDNALWKGKVLTPEDKSTLAIDRANKILMHDKRFETVLLPLRDGMHVAVKT